ncbi:hypothetical protein BDZ91DRAFT_759647 [Kalaharituber pfeilii]|nr:hypothetical protein BDZ91DRAFT_759647 [Kalaharituber pfeilii]
MSNDDLNTYVDDHTDTQIITDPNDIPKPDPSLFAHAIMYAALTPAHVLLLFALITGPFCMFLASRGMIRPWRIEEYVAIKKKEMEEINEEKSTLANIPVVDENEKPGDLGIEAMLFEAAEASEDEMPRNDSD